MPLMKYRISVTLEFLREMKHLSKRYKSLKEDLRNFGNDLLLNPEQGVSLGNNLRKIRIAITSKNKGKSVEGVPYCQAEIIPIVPDTGNAETGNL